MVKVIQHVRALTIIKAIITTITKYILVAVGNAQLSDAKIMKFIEQVEQQNCQDYECPAV